MALLLLLLVPQNVPAPPEFQEVRRFIAESVEKGASPSFAVAVVRDGRVVWAEGFGGTGADSVYLLASVSKPITATGLMVLKDRGLIDLDAPANRYLGEAKLRALAGSADEITVRRLANHTGGLVTHWNFFYEGNPPPPRDESIRRYGFAGSPPGKEWIYSNFAFGVLDYITERVAQAPWREFMEKNVYDPLGMKRTSDRVRNGTAAAPHERDAEGRWTPVKPYTFDHPGASAIWSSANDLAKFLRMHLGDGEADGVRILTAESAREMRRQTSSRADGGGTGVGWGLDGTSFSHSGGMPGVTTLLVGYPEARAGVVALANASGCPLPQQVSGRVAAVLFKGERPRGRRGRAEPPLSARFTGAWKGKLSHWSGDIPVSLRVDEDFSATVELDGRALKLERVSWRGGVLTGETSADLKTDTGFRGKPTLQFHLRSEGGRVVGVCLALAPKYFCLPHWVELREERK